MSRAQMFLMKDAEIVRVEPHRTLKEVAEVLAENKVGAIFIADADGGVIGILSQRDIIQAVGRGGAAALDEAASAHMTWRCPKLDISDYAALTADLFE